MESNADFVNKLRSRDMVPGDHCTVLFFGLAKLLKEAFFLSIPLQAGENKDTLT